MWHQLQNALLTRCIRSLLLALRVQQLVQILYKLNQYDKPCKHSLGVERILDRLDSESVASFQTIGAHTHVSSAQEVSMEKIEKKQRFFDFFTMVLSICYGIFLMIFSIGTDRVRTG